MKFITPRDLFLETDFKDIFIIFLKSRVAVWFSPIEGNIRWSFDGLGETRSLSHVTPSDFHAKKEKKNNNNNGAMPSARNEIFRKRTKYRRSGSNLNAHFHGSV